MCASIVLCDILYVGRKYYALPKELKRELPEAVLKQLETDCIMIAFGKSGSSRGIVFVNSADRGL